MKIVPSEHLDNHSTDFVEDLVISSNTDFDPIEES
jgi:hypothetical protein